jgi:monofunctional biosynthetic peptidoglycan transglycosylase
MIRKIGLFIKWLFIGFLGLVLLWHLYIAACLLVWKWHPPVSTSFMRQQEAQLRTENQDVIIRYEWVDYDRISVNLKSAVIASEDAKFSDHGGFDWESLEKAIQKHQKNPEAKRVVGGSTISQQLAKNLFLSPNRSYIRKAEEAIITFMIEALWSKERILEVYLNVAELGVGVFGAEAASQYYFQKPAAKLTRYQAARLAAMLPRPRYYDKHRNSGALSRKTNIILRRMRAAKLPVSEEE